MAKKQFLAVLVCCIAQLLICERGQAMMPGVVIDPGVSVGNLIIGQTPAGKACTDSAKGITLVCDPEERVQEISITSSTFYVARSRLRVGSDMSDLVRFYGKAEPKIQEGTILFEYPHLGIDFEVSRNDERIVTIKIYRPKAAPKVMEPSQRLQFYKEQFKK